MRVLGELMMEKEEPTAEEKATAVYALLTLAQGLMSEIKVDSPEALLLQKLKRTMVASYGASRSEALRNGVKIVRRVRGLGIFEEGTVLTEPAEVEGICD